jgi:hypothetical protein
MIEDRKHQKGVTPDPESPTGTGATDAEVQAQEAPPSRGERQARSKSRKIEIDREQMDQQFVSHQVSSTTKNLWWEKFSAVKHCSKI